MRTWLLFVVGCGQTVANVDAGMDAQVTPEAGYVCETAPSQPTDIINLEGSPAGGLVVVGPYVYYTIVTATNPPAGAIRRVKRTGGPSELVSGATEYMDGSIASDGTDLFYPRGVPVPTMSGFSLTYPGMQRIALSGGAAQAVPAPNGTMHVGPQTSGRGVYWTVDPMSTGTIAHWDGTMTTQPVTGGTFPSWLVDGKNIYWIAMNAGMSDVMATPIGGGSGTSLGKLPSMRYLAAQDDGYLYFSNVQMGPIQRMAKTGGALTDVTPPITAVQTRLLVHEGWLYYIDLGSSLMRIRTTGGAMPEPFAPMMSNPINSVVGDACGIYWVRANPPKLQWKSRL